MNDALFLHRIHFAFTITFHYLFPQLTMGLAPLIVVLKTLAIRTGNEAYNESPRASGQDLRHQLRSWVSSPASPWNSSSAPIGRSFRAYRRRDRPDAGDGRRLRLLPGVGVPGLVSVSAKSAWGNGGTGGLASWCFLGSWLSGFFIIVTDAWMQHPVAYTRLAERRVQCC